MPETPTQNNSLAARLVRGEERNLTNCDIAKIVRKSPATVRWMSTAHPDQLPPSFKVGKTRLYPESTVIAWLESHMPSSLAPSSPKRGRRRKTAPEAPVRVGVAT